MPTNIKISHIFALSVLSKQKSSNILVWSLLLYNNMHFNPHKLTWCQDKNWQYSYKVSFIIIISLICRLTMKTPKNIFLIEIKCFQIIQKCRISISQPCYCQSWISLKNDNCSFNMLKKIVKTFKYSKYVIAITSMKNRGETKLKAQINAYSHHNRDYIR